MFNTSPNVRLVPIHDGHHVVVVDDALAKPQRFVDYAAAYWHEAVVQPFNAYPGAELRMPDEITARLDEFFMRHVRTHFDARRMLRSYSRMAIVSDPPERLAPRQWLCHRDRMGVPPEQFVAAAVLYLFHDAALGGTSFFRPLRPADEIDRLVHDSGTDDGDAFARRHGIARGYMTASNAWFEKTATIAPKWNRLIFYDGMLFHCSDIPDPTKLDPDPRRGRLTLNGFFTCRRHAT